MTTAYLPQESVLKLPTADSKMVQAAAMATAIHTPSVDNQRDFADNPAHRKNNKRLRPALPTSTEAIRLLSKGDFPNALLTLFELFSCRQSEKEQIKKEYLNAISAYIILRQAGVYEFDISEKIRQDHEKAINEYIKNDEKAERKVVEFFINSHRKKSKASTAPLLASFRAPPPSSSSTTTHSTSPATTLSASRAVYAAASTSQPTTIFICKKSDDRNRGINYLFNRT